ncbi:MAG: RIO1 family regulatory kinase/ATPase [Nanopusillaceae archaeon]
MKYREIWKVYNKVFDATTLEVLEELKNDGFISEDLELISEGKEAIVCRSGNKAIKIYKVLNISYRNQIKYLQADPRIRSFPRTRVGIIYTWVKKEFKNLRRMFKSLVSVPVPYVYKKNILVMEFIGDKSPAPILNDVLRKIENKEELFNDIIKEYWKIYHKAKLIHGDFSSFNIMYFKNKIYIIDVSQSIPINSPAASELLNNDIKNIYLIGKKLGLNVNIDLIRETILNIF